MSEMWNVKCWFLIQSVNQSSQRAFPFFSQLKAKKCVMSVQLYRQSNYTKWQKEMPFHDSKEILHYFTQGTYFYMIELYLCFLVYWWWTLISIKPFNLPGILEWMKFSISLSDRYESVWATQSECRGTFSMYFCRLRDGFCCQTFFCIF